MNKWWKKLDEDIVTVVNSGHYNLAQASENALLRQSLNDSGVLLHSNRFDGHFKCGCKPIIKLIKSLGGREVKRSYGTRKVVTRLFTFIDGVAEVYGRGDELNIIFAMGNKKNFKKLNNFLADNHYNKIDSNDVFVITTNPRGGLTLTEVGIGAQELERDNYDEMVLESFDKIILDLNATNPTGRISILEGPPGTGKTFLIKGILHDAPAAICVIIPSEMIGELGGPSLLPVLMQAKEYGNSESPVILILEDADSALRDRSEADFGTISTLLNLGDGILGGLLDLRILATTNASSLDMDKAIIRSGRLSQRMTVGELAAKHANKVLSKLIGQKLNKFKEPTVLADVYKEAKGNGWSPEPTTPSSNDEAEDANY